MSTDVEICNNALLALGANTISSLSETSTEAVACNTMWNRVRESLLRAHPWNFAIKRAECARLVSAPAFRYSYQYQLPSDTLRILTVYNDPDYKKEGSTILTNKDSCFIKYIKDSNTVSEWDASFIELMVLKLRMELAYKFTNSSREVEIAASLFKGALDEARAIDASEDIEDTYGQFDNDLINVRY